MQTGERKRNKIGNNIPDKKAKKKTGEPGMTIRVTSTEDRQYALDAYSKTAERWQDDAARYRRTFAEDYCRGAVAIVYDLKISTLRRSESDWLGEERFGRGGESRALLVFHHQTSDLIHLYLRNEKPVLVQNVESVQLEDRFALPSVVRLYFTEKPVFDNWEDGEEFRVACNKTLKLSPFWVYREVEFVPFGQVDRRSRDLVPGVVQGTPEIVQAVSQDQAELIRQGLNRGDLDKLVAAVRVSLDDDRVRTIIATEEAGSLRVKILDVLVGPFNL